MDTDHDGVDDGVELGVVGFDQCPATTTDPRSPDHDGDGLSDGQEDTDLDGCVDPGETNPAVPQ